MGRIRTLILGAAGRDFHNFNMVFRDDPAYEIMGFTAQQIPHIAERTYPPELAGQGYPTGIPIHPEAQLEELIESLAIELCVLSYSDLSHETVGHLASRATASGSAFTLLSAQSTMLRSSLPVVSVCASRTGAGKSQTSREVVRLLRAAGLRVGVLRHPMPYGDLARQRVQRFASEADLELHRVTIEEREEYEPHLAMSSVVWAGVDYAAILHEAEHDAQVIVWDGGNNDTSFLQSDVYITVVDPHRAGDEIRYYPGETNVRLADLVIINKVDTARPADVQCVRDNVSAVNAGAEIEEAESRIEVLSPEVLRGRAVIAVEDGPTLTHGGMRYGAASLSTSQCGATLLDARPWAVGELAEALRAYPHIDRALPALGYGDRQLRDLEQTIAVAAANGAEAVAIGTPIDLTQLIRIPLPSTRVRYSLHMRRVGVLERILAPVIARAWDLCALDIEC